MLGVPVDGEEADYLLWDVLDAANVYANPAIEPDAEHLCLAVLAIEGEASALPTANWDNLIERAVERLAGAQPGRSDGRRDGKEWGCTCSSRCSACTNNKKKKS